MKSLSTDYTVANIITGTPSYTAGSYTLTGLVVGRSYLWTKGANDTACVVNGSITLAATGVFTATTTSVTLTGSGTSTITAKVSLMIAANLFQSTLTPTFPTKQVTIGEFQTGNPNWSRLHQISNEAYFVKRGTTGVAMALADFATLALQIEVGLTWTPPVVTTQPVAASCVHASTAASFTVVAGSEYTISYQWQYSVDGSSWSNATGTVNGCVYTNGTTATLTCTPTTTGQTGYYHRCVVTDNAGSYGLTNGSVNTNSVVLTIT